jgi:precorrin-6B methylase 1
VLEECLTLTAKSFRGDKMLSKKHFVQIARILKEENASEGTKAKFCEYLGSENERFDRAKFLKACA